MKIKRITIYSLIVLVLLGGAWKAYKYFTKSEVAPEVVSRSRVVKLARIANDEPTFKVTYPGKVRPVKHAELFFRVSGPVIERNLKYGQTVEPGEVLMRIDPRDYQREVDRLTQELEMQKFQASLAEIEFKRQQQLLKSKATSQSAFDSALTKKQTSDAQVKTLELSLKIAQDKLHDTVLIAPFHGTISDLLIEQYEIAAANVPVVVLDDLRELEIKISMPAGNLPNFGFDNARQFLGMQFDVSFPGRGNRMFKAAIYEFKPIASEESETYQLTLHMKAPADFLILPGMSCEVHGVPNFDQVSENALRIPYSAVFNRNNQEMVFVYHPESGKLEMRHVKTVRTADADHIYVEKNLLPGEFVVAAGGDWLTEQDTVHLLNPEILTTPQVTEKLRKLKVISLCSGLDSAQVEKLVTKKIEEALVKLPQVEKISSKSLNGISQITVELKNNLPMESATNVLDNVRQQLTALKVNLPENVSLGVEAVNENN